MHAFHRFTLTAGIAFLAVIAMAGIAFAHSPGPNNMKACYAKVFYNSPGDNGVAVFWDFSVVPTGPHYFNWCEAKDTLPNNWDDPSVDPCKSSRYYSGLGLQVGLGVQVGKGTGHVEWDLGPGRYVFFATINYPSTTPHHDDGNHSGRVFADLQPTDDGWCRD